jgi:hypothetical protein
VEEKGEEEEEKEESDVVNELNTSHMVGSTDLTGTKTL